MGVNEEKRGAMEEIRGGERGREGAEKGLAQNIAVQPSSPLD